MKIICFIFKAIYFFLALLGAWVVVMVIQLSK
jgi:hypothetical protein